MSARTPVCAALLLVAVAGFTVLANDQEGRSVEVQAAKIPLSAGDSSQPVISKRQPATTKVRRTRVLFITSEGSKRCELELDRLRKPGGDFEAMQAVGWKIGDTPDNHLQIVDRESVPDLVKLLKVREYPTVACVSDGEIVRSFKDGCTTPLDAWTFGWLIKGENERPKSSIPELARVETTGNYQLRGNHWTVEGDPSPPKPTIVSHLRVSHANSVASYGFIENWSYEELRSLHDDVHEREGGGVAAAYGYSGPPAANRSLDAFSGNRKVTGK